jgi:hypothetical protein
MLSLVQEVDAAINSAAMIPYVIRVLMPFVVGCSG